jgi:SNF2 family DNA or RNA helicase
VQSRLHEEGLTTAYLDGGTTDRASVVRDFREGDAPVFLISLKAGGFGLTLTEADYVFVLDPWWNPAAEEQAIDRVHRIGQDRTVFVYRFVSAETIEEKVVALQEHKRDLFTRVIDKGGSLSGRISADEIRALLE